MLLLFHEIIVRSNTWVQIALILDYIETRKTGHKGTFILKRRGNNDRGKFKSDIRGCSLKTSDFNRSPPFRETIARMFGIRICRKCWFHCSWNSVHRAANTTRLSFSRRLAILQRLAMSWSRWYSRFVNPTIRPRVTLSSLPCHPVFFVHFHARTNVFFDIFRGTRRVLSSTVKAKRLSKSTDRERK